MVDREPVPMVNAYGAGKAAAPAAAATAPAKRGKPAKAPKPRRRGGASGGDRARGSSPGPRAARQAARPAARPSAPAGAVDPLLSTRKMVNTRVPADLWTALAERAARAGVSLRVAVIDALLASVELGESDHTARLRGTVIRETEARAAAHESTADAA